MATTAEVTIARAGHGEAAGGVREVALLAYPVVLQTLSDTLMQVVDTAIVGRLGVAQLGGVGFGGIWLWTLLCGFVGTATGVQTFVAQAFGATRYRECGPWIWQAIYALLPISILWFVLLAFTFGHLMSLFGPSAQLSGFATSYAQARLFGAPAIVVNIILTSFLRGLGDTRTPLVATVIANVVNVAATWALVFGTLGLPAFGVAGAGIGTALANWTYLAILSIVVLRPWMVTKHGTSPVAPNRRQMRRFATTSIPIGGQWVLDMASFAVFSTIIARMGDAAMAASQALIQLLALSFMQAYGISIASGALVGRYIGARDLSSAERSHRSAMRLGFMLAGVVAVLFLSLPETLLAVFTTDSEVIALGRPLLLVGALFQLIDAVGIIAGGSLRGAGDTRWPFIVQTSLAWLLRLPVVYLAAVVLQGGVTGAWIGEMSYVAVLGAVWLWRFRAGAWKTIRI
jgi:MATE family multidrug resistance protein